MIKNLWRSLTDKQQLVLRDRTTEESHWRVNISPIGLWGSILALVAILFIALLLLMAYTSILNILPQYRTKSERMNIELKENIMRLDSIERHMAHILAYNEAVSMVLGGSTPTLHSTLITDTIRYDKSRVLPTRADTLLRQALESTVGEYSLNNTKQLKGEAAMFNTPLHGTITYNFDAPESSYGVTILSLEEQGSVMAVENGTVLYVEDTPDGIKSVTIQHAHGYVSVYRQLYEVLVRKGQVVQSGTVIGRLAKSEESDNLELAFELWRDGTAVDPERYILF